MKELEENTYKKLRNFWLCRILFVEFLEKRDFSSSWWQKGRTSVSRGIIVLQADAAAFPMVPLSVRAWIITTVSFSETCNSLEERALYIRERWVTEALVLKIARKILMDGFS